MRSFDEVFSEKLAIVAHRGGGVEAPENTVAGIKYGLKKGADIIEVDVRSTKDGEIILLHDEDFERVCGIRQRPEELECSYIKDHLKVYDIEPVATLQEAIDTVKGKALLFIEIKDASITSKVIELIQKNGSSSWSIVISFSKEAIEQALKLDPTIKRGLVYSKPPGLIKEAKELECDLVLPHFRLATLKANRFAHSLGLKVVAWTINDESEAIELYQNGVDAIATDTIKTMVSLKKRLLKSGLIKKEKANIELLETEEGALLYKIVLNENHFFLEQNPYKESKYSVAYRKIKEKHFHFFMFWEIKDNIYTGKMLLAQLFNRKDIDTFLDKFLEDEEYKKYKDIKDKI